MLGACYGEVRSGQVRSGEYVQVKTLVDDNYDDDEMLILIVTV
jgi:hypothetical protein